VVAVSCRFPNEIRALKNVGAIVLRVKRGPEPAWYNHAKNYNKGIKRIGWALGKTELEKAKVHASEYSWVGSKFDYVVENDTTLDDLYTRVEDILKVRNQITLTPA
jgi:hypothetical protein